MELKNIKYFRKSIINIVNESQNSILDWIEDRDFYTCYDQWKEHPEWLMWFLAHKMNKRGYLTHAQIIWLGCQCAKIGLEYVPKNDYIASDIIDATEKFVRNRGSIQGIKIANRENIENFDNHAAYAAHCAGCLAYYCQTAIPHCASDIALGVIYAAMETAKSDKKKKKIKRRMSIILCNTIRLEIAKM